MIPLLKAMQKKISGFMQNYSSGISHIKQFQKMLDEFEDTDLAQCTDQWTKPYEYNVFSVTNQPKEGETVADADKVKPE